MKRPADVPPDVENRNHTYLTSHIPWYVHALWISYWVLAISYVLYYQFPIIRDEILTPPP